MLWRKALRKTLSGMVFLDISKSLCALQWAVSMQPAWVDDGLSPPVLLELAVPTAGVGYVLPDSCNPPSGALIIILRGGMDYKRAIPVLPFGGLSLCTAWKSRFPVIFDGRIAGLMKVEGLARLLLEGIWKEGKTSSFTATNIWLWHSWAASFWNFHGTGRQWAELLLDTLGRVQT